MLNTCGRGIQIMPKARKLIKQALGVDNHVNFLYIKKDSKRFRKCMKMVESGLLGYCGETASSGSSYFFVTPKGRKYNEN